MPTIALPDPYVEDPSVQRNFEALTKTLGNLNGANITNASLPVTALEPVPMARLTRTANLSVANNTSTAVALDAEDYDSNTTTAQHDTVTNNDRLTCQFAGLYSIYAGIEWAASAVGTRIVGIERTLAGGGAAYLAFDWSVPPATAHRQNCYTEFLLAVGDYVRLMVFQTSGGALNLNFSASYSPVLGWSWRSAA